MFVVTHFDKHGTKEWLTLGKFASADEAARCYDRHVKATDGTRAKLNFPEFAPTPSRAGGAAAAAAVGVGVAAVSVVSVLIVAVVIAVAAAVTVVAVAAARYVAAVYSSSGRISSSKVYQV